MCITKFGFVFKSLLQKSGNQLPWYQTSPILLCLRFLTLNSNRHLRSVSREISRSHTIHFGCCEWKNTTNLYQFMHQHQILDGHERFSVTIPGNVTIYKANWMVLKTCGDYPGTGVDVFFFGHYPVHFCKYLYIFCNGLGKPFETIQASYLILKLMRIGSVLGSTGGSISPHVNSFQLTPRKLDLTERADTYGLEWSFWPSMFHIPKRFYQKNRL